ncbi:Hermansky-Pudlak syndrome 1 protein homolog [Coccinella septempunctata]|uniref:Hermansky-Pudlak syndrome 1 protein homolog n=1 Tax=Coccinella septempunctata TaxID=41139 RepID=UPI001D072757|nr:Hermansky-Pudlak syndrome 1 protein homolog [Coccinella septempunctata]
MGTMNGLMIFDHLNDIVYIKCNNTFIKHINELAVEDGVLPEENKHDTSVPDNVLVHLFSPVVTSQRIMTSQFGNSYSSIQCYGGLKICFDEFMGYLFVGIGEGELLKIQKYLSISIAMVRFLCGPDVYELKARSQRSELLSNLLDSYNDLRENDQAVLLEAIEQVVLNPNLNTSVIQALKESVVSLITQIDCFKIHALLAVKNKFLSLYSSELAKELSPTDILFSMILADSATKNSSDGNLNTSNSIFSYQVLLSGPESSPKCLPHAIHIVPIDEELNIIFFLEIGNSALSSSLYETFCHLHIMQQITVQRDFSVMRPAYENLELAVKKVNDSLKKNKNAAIDACHKNLVKKWDSMKKKYTEFLKNSAEEALLRAETLALGFLEDLKQLLHLTTVNEGILKSSRKNVIEAAKLVSEKLNSIKDFVKVKAMKNFSLASYLEDFPGLVHFIYVDRTTHRVTSPSINFQMEKPHLLTKRKVWHLIDFALQHLQEGTMSLMWKDTIFSYAYFLWFEDSNGTPLKSTVPLTNPNKTLPVPGLLNNDFYQKIKEICFPKMSPSKIRCYEIFCVHLGLVSQPCVLEHTRRLAATIWELSGHPSHPMDLI